MSKKPVIAVTPSAVDMTKAFPAADKVTITQSVCFNQTALKDHGAIPVISDLVTSDLEAEELMEVCDGLLVTGGDDVDPSRYGEERIPECGASSPERDFSDMALIRAALKLKKPIMAFCRGSQITNVVMGGTLYQDLPTQANITENHRALTKELLSAYGDEAAHKAKVLPDTPLARLLGGECEIGINSTHHQAVKQLGKDCVLQAVAPDGIVESWYLDREGQYLRAYQWHPEFQKKNPVRDAIFNDFVARCSKNK